MLIRLTNLTFRAYHGVYAQERETGNDFRIDIELEVDAPLAAQADILEGTVDYTQVYATIVQIMAQPVKLMEHLAHKIATALQQDRTLVRGGSVTVAKLNPPVGGPADAASVTANWGTLG